MPVVTRSQSKANRALAQTNFEQIAYENLKSEMRNLALYFNSKTTVPEKIILLRDAVARMARILGPAIAYISRDITVGQLKLLTVLHNRMLFMAAQLKSYGETTNANKIYDFAAQLVKHMETHFKNVIIMYSHQNRISGYVITKDTNIEFMEYLHLNK